MGSGYTEDHLVEQPAIQLLEHELGWDSYNAYDEWSSGISNLGRESKREVVLVSHLRPALESLNPALPAAAFDLAVEELTRDRSALSLVEANREVDRLIRGGVKVTIPDPQHGGQQTKVVQVIDWENPEANDFLLVSQFWIAGDLYTRRPDLIGFVNGLPLVLMELKEPGVHVREGFDKNLKDYKATIPQLFHFNGFLVVSNGVQSKIGSLTAPWEHFSDWKKAGSEQEKPDISFNTLLRGTCEKHRLLDLLENFTRFSESQGAVSKLVARNHQYLGVNRAVGVLVNLIQSQAQAQTQTLTPALSQGEREKDGVVKTLDKREREKDGVVKTLDKREREKDGVVKTLDKREREKDGVVKTLDEGERENDGGHYRGGYSFSGLVEKARQLREKQTQAEEMLWQLLRNRQLGGVKFRRQHQFGDYICDFYSDEARLVVECDGKVHDAPESKAHDKKRDAYLASQGLTVLRFQNKEVLQDTEYVLETISKKLPSPHGRGAGGEGADAMAKNRIGVFWHTQGSGKSYSMVFFAEKVFRKIPGNWTFVVITDRQELDTQIYRTFSTCGAATEGHCQATSSIHLRQLLGEDHRYVFTLIHKFRTEPGTTHPVLSDRDDIIVLTDESHRSQYDTLAMNMRTALPNAKFVAFTGTPLIAGEERTREVFGEYVSIYDFRQSVEDGATVPLFYENRTPELQITNPDLNEEIYQVIEDAGLDDEGEAKLQRVLGQRYHLITRDDRLDAVAEDIVQHYLNRGYQGKAMVVSIDKLTAVKMYEKVRVRWEAERERTRTLLEKTAPQHASYSVLQERLANLQETDMAVVVSQGQNEVADMQAHRLDILPHRERMVKEDLETKFKDPDDPFRLVFVCAMWLTGFDAPNCSTIYLDKPMRGHTLMQTIARANRVFGEKVNGLIVDYANVFAELEKALAIYSGGGGGGGGGEPPVKDKAELIKALRAALADVSDFCRKQNVDLETVRKAPVDHFIAAVERLVVTDPVKEEFLAHHRDVQRLVKAVMPDPVIPELAPQAQVVAKLAKAIGAQEEPVDITDVLEEISKTLDGSIVAEPSLQPGQAVKQVDLSRVDFEALQKKFDHSKTKNLEARKLRALIERKLNNLIRLNPNRINFLDRFRKMVEEYNKGAISIEVLFDELMALSKELNAEEERHMREQLSEEELAVFDLLTRPGPDLSEEEISTVKTVCKDLIAKLKTERLVLAWRERRTTRAAVRIEIEKMLDAGLPEKYTTDLFEAKCGVLFQHVLEKYPDQGTCVYAEAG